MKVLVNSYSCSPYRGSEPGLGWNWCTNLAKHCELFIITEEHWRENIEKELPSLPQRANMHFFYNPISDRARNLAQNQGAWLFYWYYRKWQKDTLKIAKRICKEQDIEIIHQLNWTGYREPGYLWKIKGPKYVWGPVGGTNLCPIEYIKGIDSRVTNKYRVKNFLNQLQFCLEKRVKIAAKRADFLFCDGLEGVQWFKRLYEIDCTQINESGCVFRDEVKRDKQCGSDEGLDILWVGRFLPTKLLDLALKTLTKIDDNYNVKLRILGGGNLEKRYKTIAEELGVDNRVEWIGQVTHDEVEHFMRVADLFFFTSVVEGTPAVIMESISNGLPVLCFNVCGFGPLVDESVGIKIELSNPEQSALEFADKIKYLYKDRVRLKQMSDNCMEKLKTLSWDSLIEKVFVKYEEVLTN